MSTEQAQTPTEPTPGPSDFTSLQDYLNMREGAADADDVIVEADGMPAADAPGPESAQDAPAETAPAPEAQGDEAEADDAVDPEVSEAARKLNGQKLTRRQRRAAAFAVELEQQKARIALAKQEADKEEARLAGLRQQAAPAPAAPAAPRPAAAPAVAVAPVAAPEREPEWPAGLPTATADPMPTAEQVGSKFETFDDLTAAQAQWSVREAQRQTAAMLIANRQRGAATQAAQQQQSAFDARVTAIEQKYPDFRAKVLQDDTVPITPVMAELIREDDQRGLDVAYHLATNRGEASRIAALPPARQAVEFARIVSTLPTTSSRKTSGPTSPAPPVSRAPAPTSPVGGAPTASVVPPESGRVSDYIQRRNADEDRIRGRR